MNLDIIRQKICYWIDYEKRVPKRNNYTDITTYRKEYVEFRKNNDRDCLLTGGDVRADTIFSLWLPLRFTIVRISGREFIERNIGQLNKETVILQRLMQKGILEKLLQTDSCDPIIHELVSILCKLFALGDTLANVMILPELPFGFESLNKVRGKKPYYDYMPYFLNECFDGGDFSKYFENDLNFIDWIKHQKLESFFSNAEVNKTHIIDLSGSGSVKCGIPPFINLPKSEQISNLTKMLTKYIEILELRKQKP